MALAAFTRPGPARRPTRAAGLWGALLLAAALLGVLPARAPAQDESGAVHRQVLRAYRPGDEMLLGSCLRLSALSFTDRNGPLDTADWVTLRIQNGCREPVRHLQVDLLLEDVLGHVYGARLWLLEQGEVLQPGQSKTDRYAIYDDAEHLPARWAARLRTMETPSSVARRPRGAPPNRATVAPPSATTATKP